MPLSDAELTDLIRDKHQILLSAPLSFDEDLVDIQERIVRALRRAVGDLPQRSGKFIQEDQNVRILTELVRRVDAAIKDSKYRDRVIEYLSVFDDVENMNKTIIGELNDIDVSRVNLTTEKRGLVDTISRRLTDPRSISANLTRPITEIIHRHATFGLSVTEARSAVEALVLGPEDQTGLLQRYVGQVARDGISQYNGTVMQVMQREYELDAYRYVGGLLNDSRPQCVRWVPMEVLERGFLEKELAEARASIGGRSSRFQGYSRYTLPLTWETFAIFRGGHNCIHEAIPFKIRDRPRAALSEAQSKIEEAEAG